MKKAKFEILNPNKMKMIFRSALFMVTLSMLISCGGASTETETSVDEPTTEQDTQSVEEPMVEEAAPAGTTVETAAPAKEAAPIEEAAPAKEVKKPAPAAGSTAKKLSEQPADAAPATESKKPSAE